MDFTGMEYHPGYPYQPMTEMERVLTALGSLRNDVCALKVAMARIEGKIDSGAPNGPETQFGVSWKPKPEVI